MKSLYRSFIIAFSEYSISPKTKYKKNKENSMFVLVFLPVVGLIITVVVNRWAVLYPYMCDHPVLPAVVGAVLPTILSGGSHLDGFFRTVDALCSHKKRDEKLDILKKDAHVGYSAIIVCICYYMMAFGIWSEMPIDGIFVIAFAYIISRALCSISLLTNKPAMDGKCTTYVPSNGINRMLQIAINVAYLLVCAALMINIAQSFSNVSIAIACFVGAALSYAYYIIVAKVNFGGVTEELGGYFITICEIVIPLAALFAFKNPF